MTVSRPFTAFAALLAAGAFLSTGCQLAEGGDDDLGDTVYTCDASRTVAEYCMEEAGGFSVQEASKSTCRSVPGSSWSDSKRCPGSYAKKCKDGNKLKYYYAQDDSRKACGELVGITDVRAGRLATCAEPFDLQALLGPVTL